MIDRLDEECHCRCRDGMTKVRRGIQMANQFQKKDLRETGVGGRGDKRSRVFDCADSLRTNPAGRTSRFRSDHSEWLGAVSNVR
jgi:hypothetical protein